jgi:hypothetical protein
VTWDDYIHLLNTDDCTAFIICAKSSSQHAFAGSHMLAGVARSRGIPVCTYGVPGPMTTFAQPAIETLADLVRWLQSLPPN